MKVLTYFFFWSVPKHTDLSILSLLHFQRSIVKFELNFMIWWWQMSQFNWYVTDNESSSSSSSSTYILGSIFQPLKQPESLFSNPLYCALEKLRGLRQPKNLIQSIRFVVVMSRIRSISFDDCFRFALTCICLCFISFSLNCVMQYKQHTG